MTARGHSSPVWARLLAVAGLAGAQMAAVAAQLSGWLRWRGRAPRPYATAEGLFSQTTSLTGLLPRTSYSATSEVELATPSDAWVAMGVGYTGRAIVLTLMVTGWWLLVRTPQGNDHPAHADVAPRAWRAGLAVTVVLAWLVTVASAALASLAYLFAGADVDHRRIDRDVHVHITGADLAGPAFLLLAVVIEVIVIAWHRRARASA